MSKEKLENKLRAIQELKAEHYIGTQEAWNYLQAVYNLYDRPRLIAEKINQALSGTVQLRLRATPERILGLGRQIENMYMMAWYEDSDSVEAAGLDFGNITDDIPPDANHPLSKGYKKTTNALDTNVLVNFADYLTGVPDVRQRGNANMTKDRVSETALIEYLVPVFAMAQSRPSEKDLGHIATGSTLAQSPPNEIASQYITNRGATTDWQSVFSRESANTVETEIKRDLLKLISTGRRLKRILRDQVDHRLEYRRELITSCIHENGFETFEETLEDARRNLGRRRKRLTSLKSLNAHEIIIRKEEEMIKESEYFLRLVSSERNFIRKFLES